MRALIDSDLVLRFMRELGRRARQEATVYFTGGASAILQGWRGTTIDLDLRVVPDNEVFSLLPEIKRSMRLNLELADPQQFIPPLPGWEQRSVLITREGCITFRHFDFYSQALAKIERGFQRDLDDAKAMLEEGLIDGDEAVRLFECIVPELIRYPAVDPPSFRQAVYGFFGRQPE